VHSKVSDNIAHTKNVCVMGTVDPCWHHGMGSDDPQCTTNGMWAHAVCSGVVLIRLMVVNVTTV